MKKKILAVSLIVALLAVTIIGGTLAWFSDEDEAKNVFTIGSIEIEQIEQQRVIENGDFTDELEAFVNDKMMIPVINNNAAIDDVNFQDKIVTVKNIGKNNAFVQTFVAVPASLDDAGVLHIDKTAANGWKDAVLVAEDVLEKDIAGEGDSVQKYNVYKYVYETELATNTTTTPAINGVYIDMTADMDCEYNDAGEITAAYFVMNGNKVADFDATGKLNVYVASQAIQADGFTVDTGLATFADHPWAD